MLVGHNFGRLVLKSLVFKAWKRFSHNLVNALEEHYVKHAKTFLKNLKGVAFYAVPHDGSHIENYLQRLLNPKSKQSRT